MNYLMLNNRKINLTESQIEEIKRSFGLGETKLADVPVGDTFKIGEYEFIVLEHSKETTAVILKNILPECSRFGSKNNYNGSDVDAVCYSFTEKISSIVGKHNLIAHTVDLTSNDGLKDYGKAKCRVSLLTCDLYRRYVEILDEHKIYKRWWLATAYSTPKHGDSSYVVCVAPSGNLSNNYGVLNYGGVRPFCILNSDIFVYK